MADRRAESEAGVGGIANAPLVQHKMELPVTRNFAQNFRWPNVLD
jgi:hypothetical protein